MASDSATAPPTAGTDTPTQEPLENNKVNEEAKLMEKETVLLENTDVVKDTPASDSNLIVPKEEQIDQTHVKEPEKESPEAAEKSEESTEKEKDEKVAEQIELKEEILVKECIEETNGEKPEEKPTMESVSEEVNKEKEETKIVDVSESTDEAKEKQVEPVDLHPVKDGITETEEVKIKDLEPVVSTDVKTETTEAKILEVEQNPEAKETPPEVEVKAVEKPELPEVETQVKGSETNSTPEKVVSTNQDSDIEPKKETKEDAIEKIIAEEKHVMEEPSKDEKVSEAIDVITKLTTEPATDAKTEENLKETETESKEKEISDKTQEESVTEKVAEAATEPIKEEPEITVKEVAMKQKHSNSIISKVKQSFVKAKKAIIGKSPSSKTISTEAEGEIKVK